MEKIEEIQKMADYCLNCKAKPCTKACPMNTNIPEFIQKIKSKEYGEAYNILQENNKFSYICSLVCPQEEQCQGSCVRGVKSEPTQIGKLEKFVNEWAIETKYNIKHKEIKNKVNKKVAVIGSGPAGLSCCIELLNNGYDVTVFEKELLAGGLLRYGIPDFRLSKENIDKIIENIKSYGAKFEFNKELGKNLHIKQLKEEYDYIFLAIEDGVKINYKTRVISAISDENGKITGVNCIKTNIIDKKAVDIPNTGFTYPANTVVFAIGLKPNKTILSDEGININEYGLVEIDDECRTNIENVFAGGDVSESKSTVCRALSAGRKAALKIIELNKNA